VKAISLNLKCSWNLRKEDELERTENMNCKNRNFGNVEDKESWVQTKGILTIGTVTRVTLTKVNLTRWILTTLTML
jgi:hypothetical protein